MTRMPLIGAAGTVERIGGRAPDRGRRLRRTIVKRLIRQLSDNSGQDLAEYAILLTLISIAVIVAITLVGGSIGALYTVAAGMFP